MASNSSLALLVTGLIFFISAAAAEKEYLAITNDKDKFEDRILLGCVISADKRAPDDMRWRGFAWCNEGMNYTSHKKAVTAALNSLSQTEKRVFSDKSKPLSRKIYFRLYGIPENHPLLSKSKSNLIPLEIGNNWKFKNIQRY